MGSQDNKLIATMEEDDFSPSLWLTTASVMPMVMRAVVELDVLEIIAKGGQVTSLQIASELPTQNPEAPMMLERILRLLASYSILTCTSATSEDGSVERMYGVGPACKYFLRNQDGVSMSPMVLMALDKVFTESWYHLKDAILDGGIAFNKGHGMSSFEYTGTDQRFNRIFNVAMYNYSSIVMKKVVEIYKGFDDLKEVIDVGGGIGTAISIITSKYPNIRGINFDLPHVIEHAPPSPGVEHIGGDMFSSVPKANNIFMKGILHDVSNERCLTLLKNCYDALPNNGKVIALEMIVPKEIESNPTVQNIFHFDLIMMVQHYGKERTEKELELIAKEAGFAKIKLVCRVFIYWVIEMIKMT